MITVDTIVVEVKAETRTEVPPSTILPDHQRLLLQFSFSSRKAVPSSLRWLEPETEDQFIKREFQMPNGVMVIPPTEMVTLTQTLFDLKVAAGYQLVDAFAQERLDNKDAKRIRTFYAVSFVFATGEALANFPRNPEFDLVRDANYADLEEMCRLALWRVLVYSNPTHDGISGQRFLSINLAGRKPLFVGDDDKPVVQWQTDASGERVGDAPIPIRREWALRYDVVQMCLFMLKCQW